MPLAEIHHPRLFVLVVGLAPALACIPEPVAMDTDDPNSSSTGDSDGTSSTGGVTEAPTSTTEPDATTDAPTSSTGGPICGDGVLDDSELCDDGNGDDGDACSADCSAAHCLVPVTHPTIQAGVDDPACTVVSVTSGTYHEAVVIARDVEVVGLPLAKLDGESELRPFEIAAGTKVALRRLVITYGLAERGAGILSHGELELEGTTLASNRAQGLEPCGGGVWSDGVVVLRNSFVQSNNSFDGFGKGPVRGGGICMEGGRLELLENSLVNDNLARGAGEGPYVVEGGGIAATGTTIVITAGSAVSSNEARVVDAIFGSRAVGGALHQTGGSLTITDAEIGVNTAMIDKGGAPGVEMLAEGGALALTDVALDVAGALFDGNKALDWARGLPVARGGALALRGDTEAVLRATKLFANETKSFLLAPEVEQAVAHGGAIYVAVEPGESLTLRLEDSALSDNRASSLATPPVEVRGAGGAIYATTLGGSVAVTLLRSTLAGNEASAGFYEDVAPDSVAISEGGGVALVGDAPGAVTLAVVNATLGFNETEHGGAIAARGVAGSELALALRSATLAFNKADEGDGLWLDVTGAPIDVTLRHTALVANGTSDCGPAAATLQTLGHNAFGSLDCGFADPAITDVFTDDPGLGELVSEDGIGGVLPLEPFSPLRNAGDPAGCTDVDDAPLMTDQRGEDRHAEGVCDIGAYEFVP
ncbi:choice-of-anchor Q domain-containing protein [Nannocystis radixulma]|uniref:Myxococcus cysteine-rich repeat-containing protein n=1 Tax=Nannocystis radixulma TaxID=2995305 RepID=A0ABT5BE75_9BACT|nr:choice-of-anchor Q domain-containing protein [Nannocystis radixulma]MDC0672431.1 hypothetical protein [Nannocystis radixulma]